MTHHPHDPYGGKYCVNCKHVQHLEPTVENRCMRLVDKFDPVSGPIYMTCRKSRSEDQCGTEGKLFEPRPSRGHVVGGECND